MTAVISATALDKHYGARKALDGIDLDIGAGHIVGLIGPNGAGKTTLLNVLLGLTHFHGQVSVLGLNPQRQRNALMARVSFIADVAILPGWLRVADAVRFVAGIHPRFDAERCEYFLARTKLSPRQRVRQLSKGMIVQLHLALVMAIDAELLVLDEPTLGLDLLYRRQFYRSLLEDYFDDERTIVITTHQVEEVEHMLTDVVFIREGQIVLDSAMEDLGERFVEIDVDPESLDRARALAPLAERRLLGRHRLLFESPDRTRLAALGQPVTPALADIFTAIMQEPAA